MNKFRRRYKVGILSQPKQLDAEESQEIYMASMEEWKTFLNSRAWKDLQTYMQSAVEEAKELLSLDLSDRAIQESDDSLRGGIKIARRFLAFPSEQLEELEDISEQAKDA
jgi:hypothetical protein